MEIEESRPRIIWNSVLVISVFLCAFVIPVVPGTLGNTFHNSVFTLIFISGVFIPLSQIPPAGQAVSYLSPLTYGNDLIQAAFSGTSHFNPGVDIVMLLVFILIFQFAANRLYKKFND